jgi:tetratricopeptide (TPR) repeat protein/tRNA A-37 threonylcarbamoyl transferase component Bud32
VSDDVSEREPPPPPGDWVDIERTKRAVLQRVLGKPADPLRLDRFVVLHRLGEGAMGRVYLVYDPELDRNVAFKVIRTEVDDDAELAERRRARLLREARAIGKLAHPNVVAVHEIGTIDQGGGDEVFILMEYVEGSTLREWAQSGERGADALLEAYLQAGDGLAAAHAAGIVHRDFKPDNALVGKDGRVRVVDFGLAAGATDSEVFEPGSEVSVDAVLTQTDAVMGTPAYMAPEQLGGGRANPRSDQFCFCASLYEALYGRRPFDADNVGRLIIAMEKGIRATDVPAEAGVPAHVRAALLRGLQTDPAQRFTDMPSLLEALRRDPRPRRRRAALLATVGAGLVGLGALSVAARSEQACRRPTTRLEGIWDDATREAGRVAFSKTNLGFAEDSWARVASSMDAQAEAWLDAAVEQCEAATTDPVEVSLLRTRCVDRNLRQLRAVSQALGAADAKLVERSAEVLDQLVTPRDCGDVDALTEGVPPAPAEVEAEVEALRDAVEDAKVLTTLGRYTEAEASMEDAVARAEQTDYVPVMAETRATLGAVLNEAGEGKEARDALEQAYWQARRVGHDRIQVEAATKLVFVVGYTLGQLEAAKQWVANAEADWTRSVGSPLDKADIDSNFGAALNRAGQHREALARHDAALETRRGHPVATAASHNNLGLVYLNVGEADAAREHIEKSLALHESELGPLHPSVANSHHNLSRAFQAQGDDAGARRHLQRAMEIWRDALGESDSRYGIALNTLGAFDSAVGAYERAAPHFRRAVEILRASLGPEHPAVGSALYNLAYVDHVAERWPEALEGYAAALEIFEAAIGTESPVLAGILAYYGSALARSGDFERAGPLVERARVMCETGDGAAPDCAQTRFAQALLAHNRGERDVAIQHARSAHEAFEPLADPRAQARIGAWMRDALDAEP